eukprot:705687-Rhodomonas_salina.1
MQGAGTIRYANGNVYTGTLHGNVKHGTGSCVPLRGSFCVALALSVCLSVFSLAASGCICLYRHQMRH